MKQANKKSNKPKTPNQAKLKKSSIMKVKTMKTLWKYKSVLEEQPKHNTPTLVSVPSIIFLCLPYMFYLSDNLVLAFKDIKHKNFLIGEHQSNS